MVLRNANGNPTMVVVGTKAEVVLRHGLATIILEDQPIKPGPAWSRVAQAPVRQRYRRLVRPTVQES